MTTLAFAYIFKLKFSLSAIYFLPFLSLWSTLDSLENFFLLINVNRILSLAGFTAGVQTLQDSCQVGTERGVYSLLGAVISDLTVSKEQGYIFIITLRTSQMLNFKVSNYKGVLNFRYIKIIQNQHAKVRYLIASKTSGAFYLFKMLPNILCLVIYSYK